MSNLEALTKPKTEKPKLLALDGGGIRGIITVEVLAEIEKILQKKLKKDDSFVLVDYFDYVAGTSTGAIIAACLSWGMRVDRIREFYIDSGKKMFSRANFLNRIFKYKFEDRELTKQLKSVFGNATLGSPNLKTLLMMVMRNATTNSPWSISNNPNAYYNDVSRNDCNLNFPLWQLIRASTAAPTFFPPEKIYVNPENPFVFVDGGVTSFNNPAFQLFSMATTRPYNLNWDTGKDKMLLVSIGTGVTSDANKNLEPREMNKIYNARSIPSALMYSSQCQQDFLCRAFGNCLAGDPIEREIGDMIGEEGYSNTKLFTYVRYNAELSRGGLNNLSLTDIDEKDVQPMDSVKHIDKLQRVGQAIANQKVQDSHFDGFLS